MELLELALKDGLTPKRVAATNGGEFHSSCPACGGKDRFIIWSAKNRYFCRRCGKSGDVIQYFRDFRALSFKEACLYAGVTYNYKSASASITRKPHVFTPVRSILPNSEWQDKARLFVDNCYQNLRNTPTALNMLQKRGISLPSIEKFKLGWNSETLWADWLPEETKKIWLPNGIVIPSFRDQQLCKIKIRRNDWHINDALPKYVEIHGSSSGPAIYGFRSHLPVIILESELDAMLVQQEAENLCLPIALGGATKKPDEYIHSLLEQAPLILFSLDYDEAGIKVYKWWENQYNRLFIWAAPFEKSVGDAFMKGLDIKRWISLGIKEYS